MTVATISTPPTLSARIRLRFAKRGDLRLVSHHDLMRCLERMLRRSGLPVAHSQGFNPRPKATFALALALGIEGHREVLDLELTDPMEPLDVLKRLSAEAPPGFDFLEAEAIPPGRAARIATVTYRLPIPPDRQSAARVSVADLLSRESCPYTRHRGDRTQDLDLRPFVLDAGFDHEGALVLLMKLAPEGSARPEEVLDALDLRDLITQGAILCRTDVELSPVPERGPSPASAPTPPHNAPDDGPSQPHRPEPNAERPLS